LTELLKQPQFSPLKVEEQVVVIYAGTRGFLDAIPVAKVSEFERELLTVMRNEHKDVMDAIRTSKQLAPETEQKLKGVLENFAKRFAA
jgi:F-type H+-transporting ATPase subunit alpha